MLLIQIAFVIVYYLLATMLFFGPNYPNTNSFKWQYYYPSYYIWLLALATIAIIAIVEELTKRRVR
jgi:Na+/melibiose symporter-like transporter